MSMYTVADAKWGFELETANFRFFDRDVVNPSELPNPKGQVLYVFRKTGADGRLVRAPELELSDGRSNLIATAEIGDSKNIISRIEFIFGGKVGEPFTSSHDRSKKAAFRVLEWIVRWKRLSDEDAKNIRVGFGTNEGQPGDRIPNSPETINYTILQRATNASFEGFKLMTQITTAIPLAGFYTIVNDKRYLDGFFHTTKPAINVGETETLFDTWLGNFAAVERWASPTYSAKYGRATALGFLLIVQSFVSVAEAVITEDNNLKLKVPFMPRTNFRTMLRMVCDTMQKPLAAKFRKDLSRFFTAKGHLDTANWSFKVKAGATDADGQPRQQKGNANVTVQQFLEDLNSKFDTNEPDLIQLGDTNRNKQIAALGNKVERLLSHSTAMGGDGGNKFLGAIVEFRDLLPMKLSDLSGQAKAAWDTKGDTPYDAQATSHIQTLEDEIREIHAAVKAMI